MQKSYVLIIKGNVHLRVML